LGIDELVKNFDKVIQICYDEEDIPDIAYAYTAKIGLDENNNDDLNYLSNLVKACATSNLKIITKFKYRHDLEPALLNITWKELYQDNVDSLITKLSNFSNLPKDSIPLINEKLSFQQIVIFPKITQEDKNNTIQKLKDIKEDIVEKGKSFESQARIHSQDPGSAAQGGKLSGTRGTMVPQFEATIFKLKEGEISNVFETDYGYHIIQLIERKGDDYTCRHILLVPEFNRQSLSEASNKMEECFQKLKQHKVTWEEAVVQYSNDNATKQNKGIITNPITGEQTWSSEDLNQIDQQIFLLTNALALGDITQPSLYFDFNEKKQAIRIVRLLDRVAPHRANLEQDYTLIQRAAENEKKEKTLDHWVKDKIGNAYLKINQEYVGCNFKYKWTQN
jgi:peptidyl-prolyl cis-trans isomerase SurA